jgi:hypothetical protein
MGSRTPHFRKSTDDRTAFLFELIDADASFSFLTQQILLKKHLKHFHNKGVEAFFAEMSQLHYRKTIKPVPTDSMTRE